MASALELETGMAGAWMREPRSSFEREQRGGTDQRKLRHRGAEEPIEAMTVRYRARR
jgi:hypothetical protein